ncbi:T9SS type A sorting domain-containing protein [Cytophagaceae bacterium YF14B1]|uniref:T9SS type A sorting domain-containing protein n=1 Tax=Xanthocytophaga flava TaxID=3048013 RepID=A0AAE3QPW0_9BACT|nr:ELWxxDGT repeat protein [Xanthocytophaga flavus]MDJ1481273.1 T9SS type A sorting domain-containing protein [Xanthocytophaga flavus]
MKKIALLLYLLVTIIYSISAQEQLTHITSSAEDLSSGPVNFVNLKGEVFFIANTSEEGAELRKTDGTSNGTTLVKDIYPGVKSSSIDGLTILNNTLYFFANDGVRGLQLWKSDGTADGTVRVTDFLKGNLMGLTTVQNRLYFLIESAEYSWEVWKSDGTAQGTLPVKKGIPGWNTPYGFLAVGNLFFFTLQPYGDNYPQVWRSDGTDAGTFPVIGNIDGNGAGNSAGNSAGLVGTSILTQYIVYKGELYFVVRSFNLFDYNQSVGIIKTNGTIAGTVPVKGLHPGGMRLIQYADVILLNDKLYFSFYEEDYNHIFIWECDGTSNGTRLVYDQYSSSYFAPSNLSYIDSDLIFTTAGTNGTTALVRLNPITGQVSTLRETAESITRPIISAIWAATFICKGNDNTFLINAQVSDGTKAPYISTKIWLSNGTAGGTIEINNVGCEYYSKPLAFNDYFITAAQGIGIGRELYKADVKKQTVELIKNINSSKYSKIYSYLGLADLNDKVFFSVSDSTFGVELWQSNGKIDETGIVKDINPGVGSSYPNSFSGNPLTLSGKLLFTAYDLDHGTELWSSDGTEEGTTLIKDIAVGTGSSSPHNFRVIGNTMFFSCWNPNYSESLWKTDGTASGTQKLKELGQNKYNLGLYIEQSVSLNNTMLFEVAGGGLWKSDGTEEGTAKIKDLGGIDNMITVGTNVYLIVLPSYLGQYQLWKSDGTEAGTILVKENMGDSDKTPQLLGEANGKLVFIMETADYGRELWISDGTNAGTVLLKDIYTGTQSAFAQNIISFIRNGNYIYFVADDGISGLELWRTDGTAANTTIVKDIYPGIGSSIPDNFSIVNDKIYFSAFTPEYGVELWKSDGSSSGTTLVADIRPGSAHSNPSTIKGTSNDVFFIADTDDSGSQLWHMNKTITGTEDLLKDDFVLLYPNPGQGKLTVRLTSSYFTGPVGITIFNSSGLVMQQNEVVGAKGQEYTLDLQKCPAGMYLIKIAGAKGSVTKKVIKL